MGVKKSDVDWCWDEAATIHGENPDVWRRDEMGHPIYKPSYGMGGQYGWSIDHRNPVDNGGTDHRRNLRVLQTEANERKGSKR